jgi:hypothetical protein
VPSSACCPPAPLDGRSRLVGRRRVLKDGVLRRWSRGRATLGALAVVFFDGGLKTVPKQQQEVQNLAADGCGCGRGGGEVQNKMGVGGVQNKMGVYRTRWVCAE